MWLQKHIYRCTRNNNCWRRNDVKTRNKNIIFKNNASFISCILKINNTFIENEEDLDIVSGNYSMTSGSLWNNCRDEINDSAIGNNPARNKINSNKTIASKFLEY